MVSPKKLPEITVQSMRVPLHPSADQIWGDPQYTNWIDESLSWKETCYLGDWTFLPDRRYKGPEVLKMFADISVNSMANFQLGQSKHIIHCDPRGMIIHEGILSRIAEDELVAFGQGVFWADFMLRKNRYNVTSEPVNWTKYHLQGPNALHVLERLTGQSQRDIRFMRSKTVKIAGHDVIALRQGMSGEIGFELQTPVTHGEEVYAAIMKAGEQFGIRRMGGRVAMLNHLEASYPTITFDYLPAIFDESGEEYRAFLHEHVPARFFELFYRVAGSFQSDDIVDWYRDPVELGWANRVKFDHEFIGGEALRKLIAKPRRKLVTLRWNSDDVIGVYHALFHRGEPLPDFMEMPRERRGYMYADAVVKDGKTIGVTTSRGYSAYFREMLSLCVLDVEHSAPDGEVAVVWGNPGTPQRRIRARVAPAPYKTDRGRVEFNTLPSFI